MRLAILLSGRINPYKEFLNLLKKVENKYDINVFISVNDVYSEFYKNVEKDFGNYLKGLHCEEYNVPENFMNIYYSKIEGYSHYLLSEFEKDTVAYRCLSCYYNDKYCFNMATKYADNNNFEYDIYLRFRSDIIVDNLTNFNISKINENILFCVIPFYKFTLTPTENINGEQINNAFYYYGDMKHYGKYVTSDIAYGNRKTMSIYCSCYDYVLKKNIENKGNYYIHFEYSMTTFLEDSGIIWKFFYYDYIYDRNRV